MKKGLFAIVGVILVASSISTGCVSKDPAAQEILNNTTAAMSKVTTYKTDYTMTVDMAVTDSKNATNATANMTGTSLMDVKKTNTQMNMDITVEVPAQDTLVV